MRTWNKLIINIFHEFDQEIQFHSFQKINEEDILLSFICNEIHYTLDLNKNMNKSKINKLIKNKIRNKILLDHQSN